MVAGRGRAEGGGGDPEAGDGVQRRRDRREPGLDRRREAAVPAQGFGDQRRAALRWAAAGRSTRTTPRRNSVTEKDNAPNASQRPRIDDPMVRWMDPLAALAFSNHLTVIGRATADGIAGDCAARRRRRWWTARGTRAGRCTGAWRWTQRRTCRTRSRRTRRWLTGRRRRRGPEGWTRGCVYTSEFIERSTLPADFFDRAVVEEQVQTNQNQMEKVRELGLTPVWFGQYYDGKPYGELQLPPTVSVSINDDGDWRQRYDYALVSPTSVATNAVVIRLSADASTFTRPEIPQFAGDLPEEEETVTMGGGSGDVVHEHPDGGRAAVPDRRTVRNPRRRCTGGWCFSAAIRRCRSRCRRGSGTRVRTATASTAGTGSCRWPGRWWMCRRILGMKCHKATSAGSIWKVLRVVLGKLRMNGAVDDSQEDDSGH